MFVNKLSFKRNYQSFSNKIYYIKNSIADFLISLLGQKEKKPY